MKAINFLKQIEYYETEYINFQVHEIRHTNAVEWLLNEGAVFKHLTRELFDAKHIVLVWAEFDDNGERETEFKFDEYPDAIATLKGYDTDCDIYVLE